MLGSVAGARFLGPFKPILEQAVPSVCSFSRSGCCQSIIIPTTILKNCEDQLHLDSHKCTRFTLLVPIELLLASETPSRRLMHIQGLPRPQSFRDNLGDHCSDAAQGVF